MELSEEIISIIGQPGNEELEYKAVLPPSRNIGQIIAAFANNKGGFLILGVSEVNGKIKVNGLSEDFHVNNVTHKAFDLLNPKPIITYQHMTYENKRLYIIKVDKSDSPIYIEGKIYIRQGSNIILKNPIIKTLKTTSPPIIQFFFKKLEADSESGTGAKNKFIEHYQSVLNIIDSLGDILNLNSPTIPTDNQEGKILIRILFSSCADNFETYLSDLLYEIYLAKPSSLKSQEQVTIKQVLDCSDMQEFVIFWSKKKLSKLQRGSVKGFLNDTSQISDLDVIDLNQQEELENILQIRHLYAHRNGIIDEKFLQYYKGPLNVNNEHQLSIDDFLNNLRCLIDTVCRIDTGSIKKYGLAKFA